MRDLFIGRVGRGYFFVGLVVIGVIAQFVKMTYHSGNLLLTLAYLIVALILVALSASLYARRLHDFGKSGNWALLLFVPIVNLILFVYLVWKSGDKKKNIYGEKPSPFTF